MSEDVNVWFTECQHRTDMKTLEKILEIYAEWRAELAEGWTPTSRWPNIIAGPYTVGSGLGHKNILILEGTDKQIQYCTYRFYQCCLISHDRCFDIIQDLPKFKADYAL